MIELLVGAVFSALVFLLYLFVSVLLPAAIGLLVADPARARTTATRARLR